MVFSDKEIHLKDTNVQEYIVHNASWNELINSWMNIQYLSPWFYLFFKTPIVVLLIKIFLEMNDWI